MSFILDALKKEEAKTDPAVRTALALDARDRRHRQLWQYLAVVALLINAAVLWWLFAPHSSGTQSGASDVATQPAAAAAVAAAAAALSAAAPALSAAAPAVSTVAAALGANPPDPRPSSLAPVVVTPSGVAAGAGLAPASDPAFVAAPTGGTVAGRVIMAHEPVNKTLAELPEQVRRRFPELSFSTHVFTDEPSLRAIVVNGQRLAEGQQLGQLELNEITEEGAVFLFEDYLVRISVLDSWD